jgi:uncharacterized RDD family membrane protein YckC
LSPGRRIAGALLDLAVYAAACVALFFALARSTQSVVFLDSPEFHVTAGDTLYYLEGAAAQRYWGLILLLALVQFGVLPGLTGWTPGKLATGMRVRRLDGSRAGLGQNLLRAVLWVVDGFPYLLPGLVGFVMVLARSDRRRVADLVAGTVVAGKAWSGEPGRPPPPAPAWASEGGPELPR